MASWIDKLHRRLEIFRLDARLLTAYLATCLLLLLPQAFLGSIPQPDARITSAALSNGHGGWQKADIRALTLPKDQVSVLKLVVHLDPAMAASGDPLGLYLSGAFSAEATWNGAPIGKKGWPADSRAQERPGLIDEVLPLPARLLRPGENDLTLRLSSNYLFHPVKSVIHGHGAFFGLRVSPFSAEPRRPIGYYAAPFLMCAVFFIGLISLTLRAQLFTTGGAILGGLLTAALAEISRSVVNYPYPLHDLRMLPITLAMGVTITAILLHSAKVADFAVRPQVRRGILFLGIALTAVSAPRLVSDQHIFAVAAAIGAGMAAWGIKKGISGSGELFAALGLMVALAVLDLSDFMDCGIYAGAAPLVAYLVWPRRIIPAVEKSRLGNPKPASDRLCVGPADDRRFIPLEELRAIHGAGDYAELRLKNGERILHLETLQTLAAALPQHFFRAHRSHIVNLDHVSALIAAGGGRYKLQLSDGDWMPVSRARVAELRARLVR